MFKTMVGMATSTVSPVLEVVDRQEARACSMTLGSVRDRLMSSSLLMCMRRERERMYARVHTQINNFN